MGSTFCFQNQMSLSKACKKIKTSKSTLDNSSVEKVLSFFTSRNKGEQERGRKNGDWGLGTGG